MPDLLIELFSEEIPARMQARASDDLKRLVTDGLVAAGLTYASAAAFATPRRLCLTVEGLSDRSADTREERKGPRVDAPEKAVEGFLRSTGLTRDQLEARDDKKGQVWFAVIAKPGRDAGEIVAEVLEATVRGFPWPKSMRWGAGPLKWVRPLHSILCILSDESGAEVVPLTIDGITAGDATEGHRFMAPGQFSVAGFEDYEAKLKKANVVLRPEERAEAIWNDATQQAFARGLEVVEDKGLLAEVAGLVEWPVVLLGAIDGAFLGLPAEVLQTSMKEHQKFFSVRNPKSGRIEGYVTVANRETLDDGATILEGNGRVLAARLADAAFFWENDLRVAKVGMDDWRAALENVTFHAKLGSQAERVDRIAALAKEIAPSVRADAEQAAEAARLAKLDLASEMVYEFPELQGVMGRYYAEASGASAEVAAVAQDHYAPLGPSDDVPTAPLSVAVALADKIDTLTGFWAIDEKPTGSKDPYALRRAALGVIRLVLENGVKLPANSVLKHSYLSIIKSLAAQAWLFHLVSTEDGKEWLMDRFVFSELNQVEVSIDEQTLKFGIGWYGSEKLVPEPYQITENLLAFLHDRLKVYLRDRGIRHDVIDACLAMPNADDLTLLVKRAEALSETLKTDDGENLVQGFKRANNILAQAEDADGVEYSYGADPKFAETEEERTLFTALDAAEAKIAPAMEAEDFGAAMTAMAGLRAPIDGFFDAVQVNADSQVLRRNRLNLLSRIRTICLSVADLTKLDG